MIFTYTKILKIIKVMNLRNYFDNIIYNRGVNYFYNEAVTSVEVVNDSLIKANVQGSYNYNVVLKLDKYDQLVFGCNCKHKYNCKHLVATLYYIKEFSLILDLEFLVKNPDSNTYNKASILLKGFNELCNKMGLFVEYLNLLEDVVNELSNSISKLLNEGQTKLNYELYLNIIKSFKLNFSKTDVINKKLNEIFDLIIKLELLNSLEFKDCWLRFIKENDAEFIYELLLEIKRRTSIENFEDVKEFFERTIKEIKEDNHMLGQLNMLLIDVIEKYSTEENLFKYLEENAQTSEDIERRYLNYLLENNINEKVIEYLKENNSNSIFVNIIKNTFFYKMKKISTVNYKNELIRLFSESLKIEDFKLIHKLCEENIYEYIEDRLLSVVRRENKYNYYEIEIYLNPEAAYEMLKEAGIYDFNDHVDYFLKDKEKEIIEFYQKELVDHFTQIKGRGIKFNAAMAAINKLASFKNGKYFIFSIYRLAKENIGMYETTEALEHLYNYLSTFEL